MYLQMIGAITVIITVVLHLVWNIESFEKHMEIWKFCLIFYCLKHSNNIWLICWREAEWKFYYCRIPDGIYRGILGKVYNRFHGTMSRSFWAISESNRGRISKTVFMKMSGVNKKNRRKNYCKVSLKNVEAFFWFWNKPFWTTGENGERISGKYMEDFFFQSNLCENSWK